ncbi:capsid assembly and DNA maturation protein-like protein [Ovine gammaherpesvirus 2]|uniref:Capsid assembly and DNA maturation protein-like protein n=1 Tax=Ovine gammaherpesvirus 2 TaxID=10398 RepID=A1BM52_9GAMA|nr:capsid assembly and DNA maturation protein-like protein [Ovine gammaherpesvirus 2]
MKTREGRSDERGYEALQSNLFRLMPPATHKVSLAKPNGFLRGLADIVGKYSVNGTEESLFKVGAWDPPFFQPNYADFLVHAKTISKHEPRGAVLFCYKDNTAQPAMDVLLTAISFRAAVGLPADLDPNVHRVAQNWYGEDTEVRSLIDDLDYLVEESNLHTRLRPVGVLVENNDSSFISRVSALTHGASYISSSQTAVNLVIPLDMFVDLDSTSCGDWGSGRQPRSDMSTVYCSLVYMLRGNDVKPALTFFKSSKSTFEVLSLLQTYYRDLITNKVMSNRQFSINGSKFGVWCSIGTTASDQPVTQQSITVRGNSLLVACIPSFFVDISGWQVFA